MADIKVRNVVKGTIKAIDKTAEATAKVKNTVIHTKENIENAYQSDDEEYASKKVSNTTSRVINKGIDKFNKQGKKAVNETRKNIQKTKKRIKDFKKKRKAKKVGKKISKSAKTTIKTSEKVAKATEKAAKETVKASQRAIKMAQATAKATVQAVKATISAIKAIIAGLKALISLIAAGGWVAVIIIVIICLIGLLCGSIFGIFFSGEQTSEDGITMKEVIAECNREFSDKLQTIQNENPHDEFVLDGSMAPWKDMLIVYTIKVSNGNNQQEVITIDDNKKKIMKQIFWEMNMLSSEVKDEMVTEQGINTDEMPKQVQKKVLHIKISTKTVEEMKMQYQFSIVQNKQLSELSSSQYDSLWSGVVYGISKSSDYMNWRQSGASWSNVRIGNTTSTISDIGCLVTSIAILIEKSGVNKDINPFNPGTFVEALNKNGGFDSKGNLQYAVISKVVPNFKYIKKVDLNNKSREEKLALITQYFNAGYYLTVEVKGATEGNQHWVAVIGIDGDNIIMVDPGTNQTNMWNAYEWSKTSKFNYFQAN